MDDQQYYEFEFSSVESILGGSKKQKLCISSIFLYDPKDKDHLEDIYKCKFYYPPNFNIHEQSKQAGLSAGVIEFMKDFVSDTEWQDSVEIIATTLFTLAIKQYEPGFVLWMIFSHENLYNDINQDLEPDTGITISNLDVTASAFREEDTTVFIEILNLYYQFFCLFHHSFKSLYQKGPDLLRKIMLDFTKSFDEFYFKEDWIKSYFNNCLYRGYYICPIDSYSWLYTQKCINSIINNFSDRKVKIAVFYEQFYIYSDLPQDQVEIIHKYMFGTNYHRRYGYK